ncbi:MAG: lytic transglycosylase domain-containing protein [Pseudomonadota bacterium]
MSLEGIKQLINPFSPQARVPEAGTGNKPDFSRYLSLGSESAVMSRPSSPEAKQQLEAINSMAQLELMKLNSMLLAALGGGGESEGGGEMSGLSGGDDMSNWLQVLGLYDRPRAGADGAQASPGQKKVVSPSTEKPWPPEMDAIVERAAQENELDPELIRAVIKTESAFDHQALSGAGAMGLMQLMPGTARDLGVDDPFDPAQNVSGGSRYLRQMLDRYSGDLTKALAAYNWGPGALDRSTGTWPDETQRYVELVTKRYQKFRMEKPA